jgi:hypothetical protein
MLYDVRAPFAVPDPRAFSQRQRRRMEWCYPPVHLGCDRVGRPCAAEAGGLPRVVRGMVRGRLILPRPIKYVGQGSPCLLLAVRPILSALA